MIDRNRRMRGALKTIAVVASLLLVYGASQPPMPRPRDLTRMHILPSPPTPVSESAAPQVEEAPPPDVVALPPVTAQPFAVAAAVDLPLPAEAHDAPSNPMTTVAPALSGGETGAVRPPGDFADLERELAFTVRLLLWFAIALVALGFGQAVLAFVQVRSMRSGIAGTAAVARAANAAATAAKFSSDSHQLSERAWMATRDPVWSYASYPKDGETAEGAFFILRWTNAGRTPAMRCTVSIGQKTVWLQDGDALPHFQSGTNATQAEAPVAPGGLISGGPFVVDAQLLDGLRQKRCRVFLWALLRYSDAFHSDAVRETESCLEVIHAGSVENRDGKSTDRFELVARGSQNRAT